MYVYVSVCAKRKEKRELFCYLHKNKSYNIYSVLSRVLLLSYYNPVELLTLRMYNTKASIIYNLYCFNIYCLDLYDKKCILYI